MARGRVCRLVALTILSLTGAWLLLAGIYALLPSPVHSWDSNPSAYLSSGNRVTRVYKTEDYFSYLNQIPSTEAVRGRSYFALEYEIVQPKRANTTGLRIGRDTIVDIQQPWRTISGPARDSTVESWISSPFHVTSKIGDGDGINLPWFRESDAALLFSQIHQEVVSVQLRLQAFPAEKRLLLWPDGKAWDSSHPPTSLKLDKPLLELIVKQGPTGSRVDSVFPHYSGGGSASSSPSTTFRIRQLIQSVIVPTGLLVYNGVQPVGFLLAVLFQIIWVLFKVCVFYGIAVVAVWVAAGRPAFGPWAQSSLLTKHVFAKIKDMHDYTPSLNQQEDDFSDGRHPRPLKNPQDFFRSKSPLDDLLVTFESTKHLVKPIRFGRSTSSLSSDGQVEMPKDIKIEVTHRLSKPARTQRKQSEWRDLEKGPT